MPRASSDGTRTAATLPRHGPPREDFSRKIRVFFQATVGESLRHASTYFGGDDEDRNNWLICVLKRSNCVNLTHNFVVSARQHPAAIGLAAHRCIGDLSRPLDDDLLRIDAAEPPLRIGVFAQRRLRRQVRRRRRRRPGVQLCAARRPEQGEEQESGRDGTAPPNRATSSPR